MRKGQRNLQFGKRTPEMPWTLLASPAAVRRDRGLSARPWNHRGLELPSLYSAPASPEPPTSAEDRWGGWSAHHPLLASSDIGDPPPPWAPVPCHRVLWPRSEQTERPSTKHHLQVPLTPGRVLQGWQGECPRPGRPTPGTSAAGWGLPPRDPVPGSLERCAACASPSRTEPGFRVQGGLNQMKLVCHP